MRRFAPILSFLLLSGLLSVHAQENSGRVDVSPASDFFAYHPYYTRVGFGATVGPESFLIVVAGEAQLDRFLSVGPILQLGFGPNETLIIPTLGGRLRIPWHALKRVETSLHTGLGFISRRNRGFTFNDFNYQVGLALDVYPFDALEGLMLGAGTILNFTSSRVESMVTSIYANVAYRF